MPTPWVLAIAWKETKRYAGRQVVTFLNSMTKAKKAGESTLRLVPSVDQLLRADATAALRDSIGIRRLTAIARLVTSEIRSMVLAEHNAEVPRIHTATTLMAEAVRRMEETTRTESLNGIRHVVNATGVVLHTNLGRAALSKAACEAMAVEASRYCTLEYDSLSGTRGRRGARVESLLKNLTGAEDALVVNNCAAAALLILAVLAGDGETIVSRGELVEIGGDFRVPDVMANSGTQMIEVGTTNRTRLEDYRRACNPKTRLIMRVHPSNYRIVGFADSPPLAELAAFAHEAKLPLYEDAGSGVLEDLSQYGLGDEPVVRDLILEGADIVSFSGDKLLGSAQAGLIVGKAEIVERLRKHPLYRAVRSDKLRLAALEATLDAHQRSTALMEIPALRMLTIMREEIEERAKLLINQISNNGSGPLTASLLPGESAIGGGAGPTTALPTSLIALTHESFSAQEIETRLRFCSPPIVTRISEGKVLIDLRTVFTDEESHLVAALKCLT
jgi:L-seryl-tRNA(Ser) seleniumtransferase